MNQHLTLQMLGLKSDDNVPSERLDNYSNNRACLAQVSRDGMRYITYLWV